MTRLTLGQKHTEPVIETNEDGDISRYEIEVRYENGGKAIYNYQKAKYDHTNPDFPSTAKYSASIHVVVLDAAGEVIYNLSGCVANYVDGRWTHPESSAA
jgi:hypothetical protein